MSGRSTGTEWPRVTVVIPVRDEERSLAACLEAARCQDYPAGQLEILVVDGGSRDRSPEIVERFRALDARFHRLENPGGLVSSALNLGLRAARGEYLLRIDAHTLVAPDYVRRCVERLVESGADNVGGPMEPAGATPAGRAIALAMRSRFGVGTARFRFARQVEEVDTVYLGAFPIDLFQRVGEFNPDLVRNQDYEMNFRIRRAGGRILVDPAVRSTYLVRSDLVALWRQFFDYGFWKLQMLRRHPRSLRARQLAAPALVAGLALTLAASLAALLLEGLPSGLAWSFPALAGAYLMAAVGAAAVARRGEESGLPWRLPVVFATMHFAWGCGFWRGLVGRPRDGEGSGR